ncbi:hypothetical protein DPX16_11897 [Anabarilius grahami]|uniref:Uncharacterized protein n=1 Tax=Anabarilius grahami TaxID=495550 RepID=A0A3N0YC96_ANAGA|nr:hypothetical protein DPX16_11897 [Anabarilius grahami]
MVDPRERGAKVKPMGQRAKVESRARRLEVKPGDQSTKAELATGRLKVDPSSRVVNIGEDEGLKGASGGNKVHK